MITVLRRGKLLDRGATSNPARSSTVLSNTKEAEWNRILNKLFQEAYLKLCMTAKNMIPCQVNDLFLSNSLLLLHYHLSNHTDPQYHTQPKSDRRWTN